MKLNVAWRAFNQPLTSAWALLSYCTIVQEQIVRLGFSNSRKVLHFCMWKFVRADKANWTLSAQTNFHIQKYDGLENIENSIRALEVELSNPRVRAARARCMEKIYEIPRACAVPFLYNNLLFHNGTVLHGSHRSWQTFHPQHDPQPTN